MTRATACQTKPRSRRRCFTHPGGLLILTVVCLAETIPSAAAADISLTEAETHAQVLIDDYIARWRDFYPSRAFAYGDGQGALRFEDYGQARLSQWLDYNADTRKSARALRDLNLLDDDLRIDLAHLVDQAFNEEAEWREDRYLSAQPQWYAEQVSQALTYLLVREQLDPKERSRALIARLEGVARLCEQAASTLVTGNELRTRHALRVLAGTRSFYENQLGIIVASWPEQSAILEAADSAGSAIASFERFLEETLLPRAKDPVSIGLQHYSAKLKRRTADSFDPPGLLAAADAEIREVRRLMVLEARRWWTSQSEDGSYPGNDKLLELAIDAMEADRQGNSASFLEEFHELTTASERFVEAHELATIPKPTTLYVNLSPAHFSGAAVGGVYPSGPFAPDADTLFYVPSIPDDAPEARKEGFYRSFNTHFNTMIISHEMFPGHYLQYKVAVREAPVIRSLFPNGVYVEGWGSFVEELMLDAGWADNAPLTRLAHLRKRLENATRAYVSVQVHTADWGEEDTMRFAVEEGLLAPQFAKNLWRRVVHSPLQITDYFSGYHRFKALYAAKGAAQSTRDWVDAVLHAGPLSMPNLERVMTRPETLTSSPASE